MKILSIFYENFVDIFWKFCRYFLKILSIFYGNFVDIFKKFCRYFLKNLSIFSKKFVDIFKKICRYFQKNLSIFSKKFVDIFVPTPVHVYFLYSIFLIRIYRTTNILYIFESLNELPLFSWIFWIYLILNNIFGNRENNRQGDNKFLLSQLRAGMEVHIYKGILIFCWPEYRGSNKVVEVH